MIIRLALLGGDAALADEIRAALAGMPELALLAATHSADADVLLAADSSEAAAGDLVRSERSRRPVSRILLVAPAGAESAARQALDCGAAGVVERPIDAPALRHALGAAGCFDARSPGPELRDEGHIALLGAGGGMGTTTCAVALAATHARTFVLDLALATGDAAEVAAAQVAVPDALLRIACGPVAAPAELEAGLAKGVGCRVLPAPALPEQGDLIDERGVARILDLAVASDLRAIVDCGARIGVETIPVLERASLVVIVASTDARGARGARRLSLLIARLGLSARLAGVIATGSRSPRAAQSLALQSGLTLFGMVKTDTRVPRARERGELPPAAAFAGLSALVGARTR